MQNIFVQKAKYLGNFKFEIEFNVGKKIVDVRKIGMLDNRYDYTNNEKIVSKMIKDGPSIGYKDYDIAPELLYHATI